MRPEKEARREHLSFQPKDISDTAQQQPKRFTEQALINEGVHICDRCYDGVHHRAYIRIQDKHYIFQEIPGTREVGNPEYELKTTIYFRNGKMVRTEA